MFIKLPFYRLMDEEKPAEGDTSGGAQPVGEEANSAEVNEDADVWGDMFGSIDSDEIVEGETDDPATEETPAAGEQGDEVTDTKQEPPAEDPAPKQPEQPNQEQTPEEKPAEQPSPEQEAQEQQTPQMTPEQQERVRTETARIRGEIESQLTQMYELEPDDAELFQLEPEKVLPKVAAKLHMNVVEALHEGVQSMLPQMIQQVQQRQQAQEKSVGAFFEAWPALNDEQYMDTVVRVVENYKRAYPHAPLEQVINEAGAAAMVALKLPIGGQQQQPQQQQQQPAPSMAPPPPANPGAGSQTLPTQPQTGNVFEQMFEDIIEDD